MEVKKPAVSMKLSVPFASKREAEIAHDVLKVDAEPPRGGVQKSLQLRDDHLLVTFEASEARFLRVGVNSFLEHLILITETLNEFGLPRSTKYGYQ